MTHKPINMRAVKELMAYNDGASARTQNMQRTVPDTYSSEQYAVFWYRGYDGKDIDG